MDVQASPQASPKQFQPRAAPCRKTGMRHCFAPGLNDLRYRIRRRMHVSRGRSDNSGLLRRRSGFAAAATCPDRAPAGGFGIRFAVFPGTAAQLQSSPQFSYKSRHIRRAGAAARDSGREGATMTRTSTKTTDDPAARGLPRLSGRGASASRANSVPYPPPPPPPPPREFRRPVFRQPALRTNRARG